MCVQTKEVVRSLKINGDVSGVAFSHDGGKVFVNSGEFKSRCDITNGLPVSHVTKLCVRVRAEEGEVYVWDLRISRCVNRFKDDGCVRGTSIAASPNGRYVACG